MVFYSGENAHIDGNNKLSGEQSAFSSLKRAQWALTEKEDFATKDELGSLIREILDCVSQFPVTSVNKKEAARIVIDWSSSISSCSVKDRGENMTSLTSIDWLITKILDDPQTKKAFISSDNQQLIVIVDQPSCDLQYQYSGYLVEAIEKFGYFNCDVIVIGQDEMAFITESDFNELSSRRR